MAPIRRRSIAQNPAPAPTTTNIDVTVTRSNGSISKHQYTLPSEAQAELVCATNNVKHVYPLVQIQKPSGAMGQPSIILGHHQHPHPSHGDVPRPSSTRVLAIMEALSREATPVSGFPLIPQLCHPITGDKVVVTKEPSDPSSYPKHSEVPNSLMVLDSTNVSYDCQENVAPPSATQQLERAVGSTSGLKEASIGRIQRSLNPKGGPYACPKCDMVLATSTKFAAHIGSHYAAEKTTDEKKLRRENRIQLKRMKEQLRAAKLKQRETRIEVKRIKEQLRAAKLNQRQPMVPPENVDDAALNINEERGESSKQNSALGPN